MNKKPRYDSSLCNQNVDFNNPLPSTIKNPISRGDDQLSNLTDTDGDTTLAITEIKNEPPESSLSCIPGQSDCSPLEGSLIKQEPDNDCQEDGTEDQTDDTFTYTGQFTANTIMKEEIMIECEPDMNGPAEVTKPNPTALPNATKDHQNQKFLKRRKKVLKNWQKDMIFALETDALETIKNEQIWTKYTTNKTDKGSKVIYRCRNVKSRGPQCEAGLYLSYENKSPNVTLFRSINRHTCDSIDSRRKPMAKRKKKVKCDDKISESIINSCPATADSKQNTLKRRKKIVKNWQKEKVFQLESDALSALKDEKTWAKYTTNKTDKGNKVIYRCRNVKSRGQQCEAGVYLLYSHLEPYVTLFRSINRHTCDTIDTKRKPYVRAKARPKNKIESEENLTKNNENERLMKRRKKVVKNWQKEKTFKVEADALEAVKSEQRWTKYTTNKTDKGNKVIYRCRNVKSKGQQCDAGLYLLYSNDDATVTIFRSANEHTCPSIQSKSKFSLNDDAKHIIRREYAKGLKPKHILGVLIDSGFINTRQVQINNYLAQLRRETFQQTTITLKDFVHTFSESKALWTEASKCH